MQELPADMDGLEAHPTRKNGIFKKLSVPETKKKYERSHKIYNTTKLRCGHY